MSEKVEKLTHSCRNHCPGCSPLDNNLHIVVASKEIDFATGLSLVGVDQKRHSDICLQIQIYLSLSLCVRISLSRCLLPDCLPPLSQHVCMYVCVCRDYIRVRVCVYFYSLNIFSLVEMDYMYGMKHEANFPIRPIKTSIDSEDSYSILIFQMTY